MDWVRDYCKRAIPESQCKCNHSNSANDNETDDFENDYFVNEQIPSKSTQDNAEDSLM